MKQLLTLLLVPCFCFSQSQPSDFYLRNREIMDSIRAWSDSVKARPTAAQAALKSISYLKPGTDSVFGAVINAPGDTSFIFRYRLSAGLPTSASTGNYTDLINKPVIPTNTNQLTNGAGFITNISFPTTTASFANSTDKNFVTDAKLTVINSTSGTNTGDQTIISGNAGTATTLQTARLINGQSFNGSADIVVDNNLLTYAALGSPFLAQTVGQDIATANTSTALVDGQIKYEAVYLPKASTLIGVRVYVRTLGSYTGDNNNRIGLYTYSGGTLTLVASSTNNATLWTSAANAFQTIAFSGTYSAVAGLYFVGFLYNNSAQVTAPTLASGTALNNAAMATLAFANSAKLHGTSTGTDLPASITMSSITASTIPSWVTLY